jgi:aminomethyltransferase
MGMPLYGHELTEERNAAAAGHGTFLSRTKEFIGSDAIRKGSGMKERLAGLAFEGRQAAREGSHILSEEGEMVGTVTSGSFAPSLGHAVALGYVHSEFASEGTHIAVAARHELHGRIVELPFYKEGTARKTLSDFL